MVYAPLLYRRMYERIRYSYTHPNPSSLSLSAPTAYPSHPVQNRRKPRFFFFSSIYVPLLLKLLPVLVFELRDIGEGDGAGRASRPLPVVGAGDGAARCGGGASRVKYISS